MNQQQMPQVEDQTERMIVLIDQLLADLIGQQNPPCDSIFHSPVPINLTIGDFLRRIHRFTHFSKQCLVIAIIYLDRYNLHDNDFNLNSNNVHKILLACLLLATKFQDDRYYDNKAFEFAGGVNVAQLHRYELHIFATLGFNLYVDEQSYMELTEKLYHAYEDHEEDEATEDET